MQAARIQLFQGDITRFEADAIVNAANTSLLGGGGVDGAIHRAGGREILEACQAIRARQGGCAVGEAVITTAGKLPATYVIHTVGPVWRGGGAGEAELLAACYRNSLALAAAHGVGSLAFPAISCGVYGYPAAEACAIAVAEVRAGLARHAGIRRVTFVAFDAAIEGYFARWLGLAVEDQQGGDDE